MKALRFYASWFSPKLPVYYVYMLQQVEYHPEKFIQWFDELASTNQPIWSVMYRQRLVYTNRAKLLVGFGYVVLFCWVASTAAGALSVGEPIRASIYLLIGVLFAPSLLTISYFVVLLIARLTFAPAQEKRLIEATKQRLMQCSAQIIVVAGSYGKTTMKELLVDVLAKKYVVKATLGNGNTPSAHAKFVRGLEGDEEILIFELGEGKPGDVRQFAETLQPDYAVITGLAPNHLDAYKTVDALAEDILSLREFVEPEKLYVAGDSRLLRQHVRDTDVVYDEKGGPEWHNSDVRITATATKFKTNLHNRSLEIVSRLPGRHQVAPLSFVAAFAAMLGVPEKDICQAIEDILPYEHRMQPYQLGGAIIIDDTYNGNAEGIMAGLSLLLEIEAKRKIYVTPGLVDQGSETDAVHRAIAAKIAETKPDWLILMDNSATKIINDELNTLGYKGTVTFESAPLRFYENLDQFVRAGDVVLMQNDWTDNYR